MVITVKRTKQVVQFEPVTIEWSQEIDGLDPLRATEDMVREMDGFLELYISKMGSPNSNWDAFNRVLEKTSEMNPISIGDLNL